MKWQNFITVYDVLVSILPSALSTFGTILIFDSPFIPLIIGLLILFLVLGALIQINLIKKEKALAEILATGYFINFLEPLVDNIHLKTEIHFTDSEQKNEFEQSKIKIHLFVPASTDALEKVDLDFKENKAYKNIQLNNAQTGGKIWLKAIEDKDEITLFDFPRTLFSLPKFIKKNIGKRKDASMKKYYDSFYTKLESLIDDSKQNVFFRKIEVEKIGLSSI